MTKRASPKDQKSSKKSQEFLAKLCEVQKISPREMLAMERKLAAAEARLRSAEAKYDETKQQLEAAEQRCDLLLGMDDAGRVRKWSRPRRVKHGSAAAVMLLSDLHVEETVEPETVNWMNQYDLELAEESIQNTFRRGLLLTEDARHLANIKTLVLWLGGDIISGYIHDELVENNSLSPLAACRWAEQRLEAGIRMLANDGGFDDIVIVTSYGNHGRTTHRMRFATAAANSYEQNMYLHLRQRTSDLKNVGWQVGEGYHNWLDVLGWRCRFHHGDAIRFQGGVGGLAIPANKKISGWNKGRKADYDFFGHWHQFGWPHLHWVSNGSMIGYNAYAVQLGCEWQPPYQSFCVIDKDHGMTRALPIFCRNVEFPNRSVLPTGRQAA